MKNINEMNKAELKNHMFSLISERDHLKTLLQPEDTGHIHTTIDMLEDRIEELGECLVAEEK